MNYLQFRNHDYYWRFHYCCLIVRLNYYDDCYCFCDGCTNCIHWLMFRANGHCQYHDQMWWHHFEFGNFGVDWSDNCLPHWLYRLVRGTDYVYHVLVLKFSMVHISHWNFPRLLLFSLAFQTDDLHSFRIICEYWYLENEKYSCKRHWTHMHLFINVVANSSMNVYRFQIRTFLVVSKDRSFSAGIHRSQIHHFYSSTSNKNRSSFDRMSLASVCVTQNYFCPHENAPLTSMNFAQFLLPLQ